MDFVGTVAVTSAISSFVGALVSTLVSWVKSKQHSERSEDAAIKAGMCALLWRELKNIHEQAEHAGGLNTEDRKHLEGVYATYHALHGNGTGTRLFQDAMKTKVLD